MSRYFTLTKTLLKSTLTPIKTKKNYKTMLFIFAIALSFVPLTGSIVTLVSAMYDALLSLGQEGLVLGMGLSLVSAAIFFFGIFYVINVFYFSKDIETLLPLPFKPSEILGAKFTVVLIYEYITELLFLAPILVTYGVKSGADLLYYIYSLLIFLTFPIVPLVITSAITMLVMRFTNVTKNKDRFRMVGGIFALLFAFGINAYFQRFNSNTLDESAVRSLLLQGNNSLLRTTSKLFPNAKLATYSLINSLNIQGLSNLLYYLGVCIVFTIIFLVLGEMLYFKGVIGVTETSAKRRKLSNDDLSKEAHQNSAIKSYVLKEFKILFRSPVYFMNCLLMTFLFPLLIMLPFLIQPDAVKGMQKMSMLIQNPTMEGTVIAAIFAFSLFISSSNSIAASAISREGQGVFVTKYIPMGYMNQIIAKSIPAAMMGLIGSIIFVIIAVIIIKLPLFTAVISLLLCILGVIFSSFIGIFIDLNFPKLIWDNEQKAVKQNFNVVINILICSAIAGLTFLTVMKLHLGMWITIGGIMVVFGLFNTLLYRLLSTKGVKLFKGLEA